MDPDQTAPIGAVCSGSTLFASKLNLSVMLGNYLQQTTSADVIFQMHIFLALIRLIIVRSKLLFILTNAYSVKVSVRVIRHVIIEDNVHSFNIHTTTKQVRSHQYSLLEIFKLLVARQSEI